MARNFASASSQFCQTTTFAQCAVPNTIACWFRATSTSGYQRVASWSDYATTYISGSILLNYPSAGDVASQVNSSLPYKSGFSANTWHHAASVNDTTAARVYLDGVAGANVTYGLPSFSTATYFTLGKVAATQYLDGRVAYVAVWNAALTAAEVASLAAGYHPRRVRRGSLIACWDEGGFYGENDVDHVGGYSLTPSGSPTFADSPRIIYPQGPIVATLGGGGVPASSKFRRSLFLRAGSRGVI